MLFLNLIVSLFTVTSASAKGKGVVIDALEGI
jgi:hypothetical protein